MSDTTNQATEAKEENKATAEQPSAAPKTLEEALAEAEKWKHLSRKNEQEKLALLEKADKWQQYEESQKTELQKLQEQLAAERAAAQNATIEATKLRIGVQYGFTEQQLRLLSGATVEELQESAEILKQVLDGTQATTDPATKRVVVIPSQSGSEAKELPIREQAAQFLEQLRNQG